MHRIVSENFLKSDEADVTELYSKRSETVELSRISGEVLIENSIKTPADQQNIFRPNCSSNDRFLKLKSNHYTTKTLRGLMEKSLTLFEQCYAISEGYTLRRHQTPICFFLSDCV